MHQTTTIMLYFLHFIWKVEGSGGDARKQEKDSIPFKVHFLAVEAEADRAVRLDDACWRGSRGIKRGSITPKDHHHHLSVHNRRLLLSAPFQMANITLAITIN